MSKIIFLTAVLGGYKIEGLAHAEFQIFILCRFYIERIVISLSGNCYQS
jgi:hypothetical protein